MDEMNVQNAPEQDTIPAEVETQQDADTRAEADTAPQGSETSEEASAQSGNGSDTAGEQAAEPVAPFLEIQYNHEKRGLSRDEAAALAQKGIYYEGTYNTLERVATLKGQTVDEFLSGIETAQDEAHRQSLIAKFGDDTETVDKMMELYNINKQKTLDAAKENRKQAAAKAEQSENERIAQEFSEMKNGDFPELTEYSALPAEVKKAAINGMSLSHAYLQYMHRENKKIAAAKESEKAASQASAGTMESPVATDGLGDAFLKGLIGK